MGAFVFLLLLSAPALSRAQSEGKSKAAESDSNPAFSRIRDLSEKLHKLANGHHWAEAVKLFADDAEMWNASNELLRGRNAINEILIGEQAALEGSSRPWSETSPVLLRINGIRMLNPDTALADVERSSIGSASLSSVSAYTLVFRSGHGNWEIVRMDRRCISYCLQQAPSNSR